MSTNNELFENTKSYSSSGISCSKPLTEDWKSWLRLNAAKGCSYDILYNRCVNVEGFHKEEVKIILNNEFNDIIHDNNNKLDGEDEDGDENNKNDNEKKKTNSIEGKNKSNKKRMNNAWKETIRIKLDQGIDKEELFYYCIKEGFCIDDISRALGQGYYRSRYSIFDNNNNDDDNSSSHKKLLAFQKRTFQPRSWKLDTELVEMYEIPNFLSTGECQQIIQVIDNSILEKSVVTQQQKEGQRPGEGGGETGEEEENVTTATSQNDDNNDDDKNASLRTSRTCHLRLETQNDIVTQVEQKLRSLMGPHHNPTCSETLQGQVYHVKNDYFKPHCDWFEPNTREYERHCASGGQRTWTVMVYLNNVEVGGETQFVHLDRTFKPQQGYALIWNNLDADNTTPNPWTLHEAMPVLSGTKYVLTKWYREKPMI